ncbi:MAG TPA: glycosyltransferase [Nocardioidaceae bacterium]|nr:glycosyltransferase [Nocardioidaceae bacterium]
MFTRSEPCPTGRRRVALYSHDTQGLGHTRRNIVIAASLVAARPGTDVLLLTGAPEATVLPLPPSTEVLTLPTLHKHADGHYSPRVLSGPLADVLRMRSLLLDTALTSFDPDLFVVDKVARGVHGELDPALIELREHGRTRTVLGLRDVLDTPVVARREWQAARTSEAVRDLYDEVWVYGDPTVYDPVQEYALPREVTRKLAFTGYLAGLRPPGLRVRGSGSLSPDPPAQPFVVCTVGGGQDGLELARSFLHAVLPRGLHGVILTGPYMPGHRRAELIRDAERRCDVTVHEFVAGTHEFLRRAEAVVSMGGYNSVCELLDAGCPALIVPRVTPRTEQALRADRLARAGCVDVLPPAGATPGRLGDWLAWRTRAPGRARRAIDLGGTTAVPKLADRLCRLGRTAEEVPHVAV